MIITFYGFILFILMEWVKHIKIKPPEISGRRGDAYEIKRSRPPK